MSDELDDIVVEDLAVDTEKSDTAIKLIELGNQLEVDLDELHDIEVVDFLDAVGVEGPSTPKSSQAFMLDEIEDVEILIDLGGTYDESKALALRPVQNVLAVYSPQENEILKNEIRSKEISDIMNETNKLKNKFYTQLREFLDKPAFDIFPKGVRFTSAKYHKDADFRTFIIARSYNLQNIQLGYTEKDMIEDVLDVYKVEYDSKPSASTVQQLTDLLKKFIKYAHASLEESIAIYESTSYKQHIVNLICPEIVTAVSYVCQCGNEIHMPGGRPPLCFFIKKLGKDIDVRLMNTAVPCEQCRRHLALPEALVEVIEFRGMEYIRKIQATYESYRIYRPRIDVLLTLIPSDAKELFQFEDNTYGVLETATAFTSTAASQYRKLINMWMSSEIAKERLEEIKYAYTGPGHLNESKALVNALSKVKFDVVVNIYSYQFVKTLLLYLEEFCCFALTAQQASFYEYCRLQGIQKYSFERDFANTWIKENGWALASLNNLFDGDTSMDPLYILPEYVDSVNYVLCLHLLSNKELLNKDSKLNQWLKAPHKEHKFFEALYTKHKTREEAKLVRSKRDLIDKTVMREKIVWNDLYHFARTILEPDRTSLPKDLRIIRAEALTKNENEFYGINTDVKFLIRPTLRFVEFQASFAERGWALFTGSHCSELRKNLAKGIALYAKGSDMSNLFNTTKDSLNDISQILIRSESAEKQLLLLETILRLAPLPGELTAIRDQLGHQVLMENLSEYEDHFITDEGFMSKFGDVIKCYL